jgi:hypothetical protein
MRVTVLLPSSLSTMAYSTASNHAVQPSFRKKGDHSEPLRLPSLTLAKPLRQVSRLVDPMLTKR